MKKHDARTLSQFTKAKLKMGAKEFGEAIEMPRATLYWKWKHENQLIRDEIELFYHTTYDDL